MESELREVSIHDLYVDEAIWGRGAEPIVKDWLLKNYDPRIMPRLEAAASAPGAQPSLLGWKSDTWPPLLEMIFGPAYAQQRLEQVEAEIADTKGGRYGVGSKQPDDE